MRSCAAAKSAIEVSEGDMEVCLETEEVEDFGG